MEDKDLPTAAQAARAERERRMNELHDRIHKANGISTRWKTAFLFALTMALIGWTTFVFTSIALSKERDVQRTEWIAITQEAPPRNTPVVVRRRDGEWSMGYLNENGEFTTYCSGIEGERIRGALYWMKVPANQ